MPQNRVLQVAAALAAMLGGALAAAPALGDRDVSQALAKRVVVTDNFFEPRSVSVHPGDKVVWVWKGDNFHNVTFVKVPKGASRKGAEARREGRWSRRLWKSGYYKFACTIHAGQRGSIEVVPQAP
jgi:plastocyanin